MAGRADVQRIADAADKVLAADPRSSGQNVAVLGVQRPAQIVNYHSIGSTPVILAVGLGAEPSPLLAQFAASVRRRRRDLALLKTLGFTQKQLAAAVAWQATVAAITGVIVGIPFGIVIGRELWTLFAHNLNAVPDPSVPAIPVTIVAVGLSFSPIWWRRSPGVARRGPRRCWSCEPSDRQCRRSTSREERHLALDDSLAPAAVSAPGDELVLDLADARPGVRSPRALPALLDKGENGDQGL